jgi:murein DD-endopeptidase MepM/ murein hydrolase activator NlpD
VYPSEAIESFIDGHVSKIGYPYAESDKAHLRYVEVTGDNGDRFRHFYAESLVRVGDEVEKGAIIAWSQCLQAVYPGITPHQHFEIKTKNGFIDPVEELKRLGYEFEE